MIHTVKIRLLALALSLLAPLGAGVLAASPAHAEGERWESVYVGNKYDGYVRIAACKVYETGAYGPVYRVKVLYDRRNTSWPRARATTYRYQPGYKVVNHKVSTSWWMGRLTSIELYASAWYTDYLTVTIGTTSDEHGSTGIKVRSLNDC